MAKSLHFRSKNRSRRHTIKTERTFVTEMLISKHYRPKEVESKWYQAWLKAKAFASEVDEREPYTVLIPPPNITGVLHMGHILNNTLQDVLVRRARMLGKNALWLPGMDHASIATEAKVVKMLREKGIKKSDIGRERFMKYAFEWKDKYGGIILEQLQKLGCSCDWDRTRFTMEEDLYQSVVQTFVKMHQDGYVYRGKRMVNWDPKGLTALSDEEVIYHEEQSNLYHIRYQIKETKEFLTIATTRPETLFGDSGIAVHPEDSRYQHLIGKTAIVPIVEREIPIISDEYVQMDFGTGALKVTPAHDSNDYELAIKHDLEIIDIFNPNGTLNDLAGFFVGVNRFTAREKTADELKMRGALSKIDAYQNKVGRSERTNAVVESRLSEQWFVDMKKFMANHPKVLSEVLDNEIVFVPNKYVQTYRHWMENIKDWCISRQLWWGQRIPAYYFNDEIVVAESKEKAYQLAKQKGFIGKIEDLAQDEDVLDTWFSSWLWPLSVFNGVNDPNNKEFQYYYPANDIVTGPDILFFWIARMIMAGHYFEAKKPFKKVYFTGIVRDKQGRKMSKSLGNSPDAMALMDEYGTDAVRFGILSSAPAGNDILFDETLCKQGRNFANKLWNAYRFVSGLNCTEKPSNFYSKNQLHISIWIKDRFNRCLDKTNQQLEAYRFSEAITTLYKFVWEDFCSWYLEMIKPSHEEQMPLTVRNEFLDVFGKILKLLHPFMPFITEELWHALGHKSFINKELWPETYPIDKPTSEVGDFLALIVQIRAFRSKKNISPKMSCQISTNIAPEERVNYSTFEDLIKKMANVSSIAFEGVMEGSKILVHTHEFVLQFEGLEKTEDNKENIINEIERLKKFLLGIEKKLSNEKFIKNAKGEIIEKEFQKKKDTLHKINLLKEQLEE